MLISVNVPGDNHRGPQYMQQVLANPKRLPVTLSFAKHEHTVSLYCEFPEQLRRGIRTREISVCHDKAEPLTVSVSGASRRNVSGAIA